jgi:predicted metal-dependent phosphotriesterase family hydrolase
MMIRTVLGDISPEGLGTILGHEHIITGPPAEITDIDLRLHSESKACEELASFKAAGGSAVVEMTTVDYGRDITSLARVAKQSGVHIVAATGYNKGKFADRITSKLSTEHIARWMTEEVLVGASGTTHRCGVIKAASSLDHAGAHELRVFEAAALAHLATGAPISTHTEAGTWALEQMQLLGDLGVSATRVLLGHLDRKPDIGYLREVAATGAYLGFDQCGKHKYLPDADRVELVLKLIDDGHLHQLMISGDMARCSSLTAYGGGPGFTHVPRTIVANFMEAGLAAEEIEALTTGNARNLLAFDARILSTQ